MRLVLFFFLISVGNLCAQKTPWTIPEIKSQIRAIQADAIHVDSLEYEDSTCTYFSLKKPYSGYVIHSFDGQLRFNCFVDGKYFGEEWIFNTTEIEWDDTGLFANLKEFRIRSDTNHFYTVVTSYYDFEKQSVNEVYIDHRYECARRTSPKDDFDSIFGGDEFRELPFKSFYENGNKKEESIGTLHNFVKVTKYYKNGQKESVFEINRNQVETGMIKRYSEDGKCTLRIKSKNAKL